MTITEKFEFLNGRFWDCDEEKINTNNLLLKSLLLNKCFDFQDRRIKYKIERRNNEDCFILYASDMDLLENVLYEENQPGKYGKIDIIEDMFLEMHRMYDEQVKMEQKEKLALELRFKEIKEQRELKFCEWLENFKSTY